MGSQVELSHETFSFSATLHLLSKALILLIHTRKINGHVQNSDIITV